MNQRQEQAKVHGRKNWPVPKRCELNSSNPSLQFVPFFVCLFILYMLPQCFLCSLMQRLDGKSKDISKIATDITQNMSLRQGIERKKVIQHIRSLYKTDLSGSRHWQELVLQLTHDRSLTSSLFLLFCFL